MKFLSSWILLLSTLLMALSLSGCEVIGDIFKAGMWTALILIVLVVLLITWLFRKMRGPRP